MVTCVVNPTSDHWLVKFAKCVRILLLQLMDNVSHTHLPTNNLSHSIDLWPTKRWEPIHIFCWSCNFLLLCALWFPCSVFYLLPQLSCWSWKLCQWFTLWLKWCRDVLELKFFKLNQSVVSHVSPVWNMYIFCLVPLAFWIPSWISQSFLRLLSFCFLNLAFSCSQTAFCMAIFSSSILLSSFSCSHVSILFTAVALYSISQVANEKKCRRPHGSCLSVAISVAIHMEDDARFFDFFLLGLTGGEFTMRSLYRCLDAWIGDDDSSSFGFDGSDCNSQLPSKS